MSTKIAAINPVQIASSTDLQTLAVNVNQALQQQQQLTQQYLGLMALQKKVVTGDSSSVGPLYFAVQLAIKVSQAITRALVSNTMLQILGTPLTATYVYIESQDATGQYIMRRANTTPIAGTTALNLNDNIGFIGWQGCDGTDLGTQSRARVQCSATENWTTTANGTNLEFYVTPNGTTSPTVAFAVDSSGPKFGTYTAGALAPAGYITITDSTGTPRRILVG
jgi:hypothetical protein